MKQFIVMCSMVLLGLLIYNLVAGPAPDSTLSVMGDVWRNEIALHTKTP